MSCFVGHPVAAKPDQAASKIKNPKVLFSTNLFNSFSKWAKGALPHGGHA